MNVAMIEASRPYSTPSFGFRGDRSITSFSGGSIVNAIAGPPSVTRLRYRIIPAVKGSSKPSIAKVPMRANSSKLDLNRKKENFLMLSYMVRPPSTALTIVAKLSSASTMSDASFVTSVPVIPMAMPISACFSAGASLTPSPVMATISPFFFNALTIRSLCSGATLA